MTKVERLLNSVDLQDPKAPDELFLLVYNELRQLARVQLSRESPGITLQPTALVNEVYLKLIAPHRSQNWESRGHFFASAAEAMRRILVDHARGKKSIKRGGNATRIAFDPNELPGIESNIDLVQLDESLKELAAFDEIKAKLVVLRFFGGMEMGEACDSLGISRTTGHRYWKFSRAWLFARMTNANQRD